MKLEQLFKRIELKRIESFRTDLKARFYYVKQDGKLGVPMFWVNLYDAFQYEDSGQNAKKIRKTLEALESTDRISVDWEIRNTYTLPASNSKANHKPLIIFPKEGFFKEVIELDQNDRKQVRSWLKEKVQQDNKRIHSKDDSILLADIEFMKKVTPPARGVAEAKARSLSGTKKGGGGENAHKVYVETAFDQCVNPETEIDITAQLEGFFAGSFDRRVYEKSDDYDNRRYTTWNGIPSWIREEYRMDGEEIVTLDATALHPNIIASLYRESTGKTCPLLEGDSHAKVAQVLGIPRSKIIEDADDDDSAKGVNLRFWNTTEHSVKNRQMIRTYLGGTFGICDGNLQRMLAYVKTNYPELLDWRKQVMEVREIENRPKKSQLFWKCINVEAALMAETIEELRRKGIVCNYLFDAISVKASDRDAAKAVFNDKLAEFKILTVAK